MKGSLFLDICRNYYGAVFQMLRSAIKLCPKALWDERADEPPFWQQAYHALWATDFYLNDSPKGYRQPSFVEGQATDLAYKPIKTPTRQQILDYLEEVSSKCDLLLDRLDSAQLEGKNTFSWTGPTLAHRLIYNIRHAQHHIGRLNSILSRKDKRPAAWVIKPRLHRKDSY